MEVKIRPLQENDAYISVNWRNDSEVFKYTGNTYSQIITIEKELEWIKRVIKNENEYRCAIIVDGSYVGNIYLTNIHDQEALYHIFIGEKSYWGKGVAKQASVQILRYAFNTLRLKKVLLKVKKQNKRAYLLYLRLGFKPISEDDTWITMAIYNLEI